MPPKYAAPYSLVKQPLEQTKTYSLFNARNKQTGDIWLARVVHHQAVQKLGIIQQVQYNEQALINLAERTHIVYVKQIFAKDGDSFFIQEKHQIRLSDHLAKKGRLDSTEVVKIIQDVYESLCDIYEEGYIHRNIRTEHLVRIAKNSEDPQMWKIETLVLNNEQFSEDTPFTWKRDTASPEEKEQQGQLDEDVLDSQIVWNFGYLALHLLMGKDFVNKKITRDSQIPWSKIKELTSTSPALYELIDRCFRMKIKERVPLSKFFGLTIFENSDRMDMSQYFLNASKMFKTKLGSSVQKSINMKSVNFKSKSLQSSISYKKSVTFQKIDEASEDHEDEDQLNAIRGNFLLTINKYVNLVSSQPQAKQIQNRSIIEYYFLKLGLRFVQLSKSDLRVRGQEQQQHSSKINTQSKTIKRLKTKDNPLLTRFSINTQQIYQLPRLIQIFNQLGGFAYSRLRQECEVGSNQNKMRALAYFGLLGYLINSNNWQSLRNYIPRTIKIPTTQYFENSPLEQVSNLAQSLLKQHLMIIQ